MAVEVTREHFKRGKGDAVISRRAMLSGTGCFLGGIVTRSALGQTSGTHEELLRQISRCTVEIMTEAATGTGFLFNFSEPARAKQCIGIVTNKHVAKSGKNVAVRHLSNASAPIIPLPSFHALRIDHPDPEVDLCVSIGVADLFKSTYREDIKCLGYDDMPSSDILSKYDNAARCLIVGYPKGIIDDRHGEPIFRSGICATRPDRKFSGKSIFLVDAAIWGGSSGSPVILYDEIDAHTFGSIRPYLIGIVSATSLQNIMEAAGADQPAIPDILHSAPNNLGICVASDMIYGLARQLAERIPDGLESGLIVPPDIGFQQ